MSGFNFADSLEAAAVRFEGRGSSRNTRSDRGKSRLNPEVQALLRRLLLVQERPSMSAVRRQLEEACSQRGLATPARATIYQWLDTLVAPGYRIEELPAAVRVTLHNVDPHGSIPGPQLAFHCFNYGRVEAMSWAAGLPWLALHQAARKRGWRPGSRGVFEAVLAARGI